MYAFISPLNDDFTRLGSAAALVARARQTSTADDIMDPLQARALLRRIRSDAVQIESDALRSDQLASHGDYGTALHATAGPGRPDRAPKTNLCSESGQHCERPAFNRRPARRLCSLGRPIILQQLTALQARGRVHSARGDPVPRLPGTRPTRARGDLRPKD
jgi:hypothetical protein